MGFFGLLGLIGFGCRAGDISNRNSACQYPEGSLFWPELHNYLHGPLAMYGHAVPDCDAGLTVRRFGMLPHELKRLQGGPGVRNCHCRY